jgi:hypothetical protein
MNKMNEKITYTLDWNDKEDSDWLGPFDDVDDVMRLIRKAKRDATHPSHIKQFRAITGVYNSLDIPSVHLVFGSLKFFVINLSNILGQYQDYYNKRVSISCYVKMHDAGCTVWFCHKIKPIEWKWIDELIYWMKEKMPNRLLQRYSLEELEAMSDNAYRLWSRTKRIAEMKQLIEAMENEEQEEE